VDSNYTFHYVNGSVTESAAVLTITASSGSFTYGGTPPTITAGYSGFVNGDTAASLTTAPSCSTTATSSSPVGSYVSSCSGASAANYTFSYVNGSVTVTAAPASVTPNAATKVYGSDDPTLAGTLTGFLPSDDVTATYTRTAGQTVGTYRISATLSPASVLANYRITYNTAVFTITPAALLITASSATMSYGGTVPTITASYSGFVNGDTAASLSAAPSCSTSATSSSPASPPTYPSTCSGAVNHNYTMSYVSGTVTVDPAPLSITASGGTFTYGGTVPTITPSYSGFAGSDTAASLTTAPSCSTTATSGSPVSGSPYTSSCTGAVDSNYTFHYVNGSVTESAAVLTITASSGSFTYGGTVPTITPSYSGFANGDTAASLTTQATCSTTATTHSPAGAYPSSCSGAVDSNYTISYVGGTVTDSAAALVITASSATMTYGGTVPTITASYSGFVNGDTAASLTTQPTCSTTATSTSPPGTYPSSCSGAVDSNYTISYVSGIVTVISATPLVSLSSFSLAFSAQIVGTSSSAQTVTLTNAGTAPVTISRIATGGDFSQTNTCGTTLSAGANCAISVTFTPVAAGTRTSTLNISDNASGSPQSVALSGTGLVFTTGPHPPVVPPSPPVNPQPPHTANSAAPLVSLSSSSLTFSAQSAGTSSSAQTVRLTNTGNASLTISGIPASGDFSQTNTCGTTLRAGANCAISVTFKPAAAGTRTGALGIYDNAIGSPQAVALSGTGPISRVGPAAPLLPLSPRVNPQPQHTVNPTGPLVNLSSSSLTFSAQGVGTSSSAQTVRLTNTGNASLTISSITASGDFSQTNTCGTTLSADADCEISVTFKPVAAGTRTGALSISDTPTGSPQSVALSGTGLVVTVGPHPPVVPPSPPVSP
jgi:hypothetical protein